MRPGLAALVAFVLLALPAPAVAGSILFVRAGDVWISTPDGATERQLTAGGGFSSPSMADDGLIVALRGRALVRLRPDGAPAGMPVDAIGGDWVVGGGPYDARVSPDGTRVAYWFTGRRRFCLPTEPGCSLQDSDVTAYAYADRVTDPLELGVVRDQREPSWYGSDRALVFRHGSGAGEAVSVDRVGSGESGDEGWFSYDDGTSLAQGQLDRAGDRLAAVAGGDEIHLFGVSQPPPALPDLRCVIPGGPFASPTWSPDGTMLAWEQADGVHVAGPVPDLRRRRRAGRRLRRARAGRAGRAQAREGVPIAAGGGAPARPRGAAAPAHHARAGARGGAAAPRRRARRPRPAPARARGRAAAAHPPERGGAAGARALRAAHAALAARRACPGARDGDRPAPRGPARLSCQAGLTARSDRRLAPLARAAGLFGPGFRAPP